VDVQKYTIGGATLQYHYDKSDARKQIASQKWDYVVLQEQSMRPIVAPSETHKYARLLNAEIEKNGSKTVFFMTWARQWWPESQAYLANTYSGVGRELHATVAPVGLAWEDSLKMRPDLVLHQSDGSHPSPTGSYLAACVFFAILSGQSPEGLPARVGVADLGGDDAKFLQHLAWAVSQSWR